MMRGRVFGVLSGVLVASLTVAAPQAAAADPCRWIPHELPLPAATTAAKTSGGSEDNRFIVGHGRVGGSAERGLMWDHGALMEMAATSSSIAIEPQDVNNHGVVVGGRSDRAQGGQQAFRYENGVYELLETPSGHDSRARSINNNGDVFGEVWDKGGGGRHWAVLWSRDGRLLDLVGRAVGVSDDRRLVLTSGTTVYVAEADRARVVQLAGGNPPAVLDNDRVLLFTSSGLGEWTLTGEHVATWQGGTVPFGRTSDGQAVFGAVMGTPTLWQWGISYPVDSAKLPDARYYGDVTDGGALIGTYVDPGGSTHPARWFWCA
ncbi:probable extracellular repeat, HAF family [Lentzea fradiae]|uniref:Probable extracellular repeat, HAF family n=1 Tax=Lentzea fradiae TaxID=200378 RepID=A0A1G7W163_9PSEU|nr:hypothetical protein [Lentzea fradiae]SDG64870.1 probable extracellular repeat, HAF family [Lentzea fradiae]